MRYQQTARWLLRAGACLLLATAAAGLPAAKDPPPGPRADELVLTVSAVDRTGTLIPEDVGGARITIRETMTGMVLAEGWQEGSPETLPFTARFPRPAVPGPVDLEITVLGPLLHPQAMAHASTGMEIAAGQAAPPDPIILTLRGLLVEVLEPAEPEPAGDDTLPAGQAVPVRARVRTLGGLPAGTATTGGSPRVVARLEQGARRLDEIALQPSGEGGLFAGRLTLPSSEQVDLVVEATTPDSQDTGTLRRHLYLRAPAHTPATMQEPTP